MLSLKFLEGTETATIKDSAVCIVHLCLIIHSSLRKSLFLLIRQSTEPNPFNSHLCVPVNINPTLLQRIVEASLHRI